MGGNERLQGSAKRLWPGSELACSIHSTCPKPFSRPLYTHAAMRQVLCNSAKRAKGPIIKNVRKIFGIFYPPPSLSAFRPDLQF